MKQVFKKLIFSVMCLATVAFCVQCSTDSGEYVDLGLPSGTKWKTTNETNPNDDYDFYTYGEAVEKFGEQLPTKEQFQELIYNCTWSWDSAKHGYSVVGKNGNSIFLSALGGRTLGCDGSVDGVSSDGYYWSSTPFASEYSWFLCFDSGEMFMFCYFPGYGKSVRLVQN
ncbi:MAG: hypothetical protein IJQ89_02965 [Bacteroidales bacterium]|nr:hypothetical protein [Bacteroidales bacterium]